VSAARRTVGIVVSLLLAACSVQQPGSVHASHVRRLACKDAAEALRVIPTLAADPACSVIVMGFYESLAEGEPKAINEKLDEGGFLRHRVWNATGDLLFVENWLVALRGNGVQVAGCMGDPNHTHEILARLWAAGIYCDLEIGNHCAMFVADVDAGAAREALKDTRWVIR
jgi:hypothetical protein